MLSAECGYHEGASQSWGAIASKLNSQAFPDSSSHLLSKSKSFSAQITISWLLQITTKMGHRPAEVVGWTSARTHPLWASSPCREGERLAVLREEGRSLPSGWCRRETGSGPLFREGVWCSLRVDRTEKGCWVSRGRDHELEPPAPPGRSSARLGFPVPESNSFPLI